jgi:integrase
MTKKRRFGRVRQLASGRWQARYTGPDGIDRPAPETFATKTDAEVWLTLKEAEIRNGDWINPDDGKVSLAEYAETWIDERPGLRPKTVDLYRYLARKHLAQVLGPMPIADIQAGHVRRWRKHLLDAEVSAVTVAKAYRLLKTIMTTAADDGAIRRNPCRIKGGGGESSPERLVLTVPQVFALSEAVDPRYRALVLLATFTSLRWGELCALRPSDIDTEARTVRVERSLTELQNGALAFGPPKSAAGRRTVGFPELIAPVVRWHLACFVHEDDGLVFTGPAGAPLRRSNFRRRTWLGALKKAELPAAHFHDLRHTGNTLTATAGANLRELMARMGHSSTRAALIYLHSTDERQREIADALGDLAAGELKRKPRRARGTAAGSRSGTQRARRRKNAS